MLRAIIIDDEVSGVKALELLLKKYLENVKVVATAVTAKDGINLIEDYKPDIVFVDISMPGMNGFDLLKQVAYKDYHLVFITAHQEFAIKAIKFNAFDYLLKPIDPDELKTCITRILEATRKKQQIAVSAFLNLIPIAVKDGIIFIRQSDIIRLEASGSYSVFYLDNKTKHVSSKNLKEYEFQLNASLFYRCHNSHIVNLKKVSRFTSNDGYFAQMTDGSRADISKKNKELFLEKLKNISE